jgi:hypothetical protein
VCGFGCINDPGYPHFGTNVAGAGLKDLSCQ